MSDETIVARINSSTKKVINIEVANQEWIDAYDGEDIIIVLSDGDVPHVGLSWDENNGFEQPVV